MDERYAEVIISIQLRLQEGDSLTINTNARTMNFARFLAKKAVEVTLLPVTIVETSLGKVLQTYPIEPVVKNLMRPEVATAVLAHIVDLDEFPYSEDEEWNEPTFEVRTLAHYGHLADPFFLDRRISIPWANIPYPGTAWAADLLGHLVTQEEMWDLFGRIMRLTDDWPATYWAEQANVITYRQKTINALKRGVVAIVGEGVSLVAHQHEHSTWIGGVFTLPSGRQYIPLLPIQALHTAFDSTSVHGVIEVEIPFTLFGQEVTEATFTIEEGVVVDYSASGGKAALDHYFGVDEGSKRVSAISIADSNTIECRYLTKLSHPHYKKECRSILHLGGVLVDTLPLGMDEEALRDVGQSIAHLDLPLPSNLTLCLRHEDGSESLIIENGSFTL